MNTLDMKSWWEGEVKVQKTRGIWPSLGKRNKYMFLIPGRLIWTNYSSHGGVVDRDEVFLKAMAENNGVDVVPTLSMSHLENLVVILENFQVQLTYTGKSTKIAIYFSTIESAAQCYAALSAELTRDYITLIQMTLDDQKLVNEQFRMFFTGKNGVSLREWYLTLQNAGQDTLISSLLSKCRSIVTNSQSNLMHCFPHYLKAITTDPALMILLSVWKHAPQLLQQYEETADNELDGDCDEDHLSKIQTVPNSASFCAFIENIESIMISSEWQKQRDFLLRVYKYPQCDSNVVVDFKVMLKWMSDLLVAQQNNEPIVIQYHTFQQILATPTVLYYTLMRYYADQYNPIMLELCLKHMDTECLHKTFPCTYLDTHTNVVMTTNKAHFISLLLLNHLQVGEICNILLHAFENSGSGLDVFFETLLNSCFEQNKLHIAIKIINTVLLKVNTNTININAMTKCKETITTLFTTLYNNIITQDQPVRLVHKQDFEIILKFEFLGYNVVNFPITTISECIKQSQKGVTDGTNSTTTQPITQLIVKKSIVELLKKLEFGTYLSDLTKQYLQSIEHSPNTISMIALGEKRPSNLSTKSTASTAGTVGTVGMPTKQLTSNSINSRSMSAITVNNGTNNATNKSLAKKSMSAGNLISTAPNMTIAHSEQDLSMLHFGYLSLLIEHQLSYVNKQVLTDYLQSLPPSFYSIFYATNAALRLYLTEILINKFNILPCYRDVLYSNQMFTTHHHFSYTLLKALSTQPPHLDATQCRLTLQVALKLGEHHNFSTYLESFDKEFGDFESSRQNLEYILGQVVLRVDINNETKLSGRVTLNERSIISACTKLSIRAYELCEKPKDQRVVQLQIENILQNEQFCKWVSCFKALPGLTHEDGAEYNSSVYGRNSDVDYLRPNLVNSMVSDGTQATATARDGLYRTPSSGALSGATASVCTEKDDQCVE